MSKRSRRRDDSSDDEGRKPIGQPRFGFNPFPIAKEATSNDSAQGLIPKQFEEETKTLYKSLRGLNVQFQTIIKDSLEEDVFADLTMHTDKYKSLRLEILSKYSVLISELEKTMKLNLNDKSESALELKHEEKLMNVPLFNFPLKDAGSKSEFSISAAVPNPFNFIKPSSPVAEAVKPVSPKPFGFVQAETQKPIFGSAATESKPEKKEVDKSHIPSPFVFGNSASSPSKDEPKSILFGAPKDSQPTAFVFGKKEEKSPKKDNEESAIEPAKEPPKFVFGNTSSVSSTANAPVGSAPNAFGAAASSFGTPFGTASASGKPSTTLGSTTATTFASAATTFGSTTFGAAPASFGSTSFGSTPFGSATLGSATLGSTTATFGSTPFGAPAATETEESKEDDNEIPAGEEESFLNKRDETLLQKGEGEEDESPIFDFRSKLFAVEDKEYKSLGVGQFRLNKNNKTGASRVLFRMEGTSKVLLNSFSKALILGVRKSKDLMMNVFVAKGAKKYLLRFKTEQEAIEAQGKIKTEIEKQK